MSSQSPAKSPEALRAMVAGTLANFQHPTLKHNLTTLKALHHVAWLDDAPAYRTADAVRLDQRL